MSGSYSYSSSASYMSSSSSNGQTQSGQAYTQATSSDPEGTTVRTVSQSLGQPAVHETRYYDSDGRQILAGGRVLGQGNSGGDAGRIEDVTDEQEDRRNTS